MSHPALLAVNLARGCSKENRGNNSKRGQLKKCRKHRIYYESSTCSNHCVEGQMMKKVKILSKDWYENWYSGKEKIFGWNIGKPHRGLIDITDRRLLRPGHVLVPGCGIGYDAVLLSEKGNPDVVLKMLQKIIAKGEANASTHLALGTIYQRKNNHQNIK